VHPHHRRDPSFRCVAAQWQYGVHAWTDVDKDVPYVGMGREVALAAENWIIVAGCCGSSTSKGFNLAVAGMSVDGGERVSTSALALRPDSVGKDGCCSRSRSVLSLFVGEEKVAGVDPVASKVQDGAGAPWFGWTFVPAETAGTVACCGKGSAGSVNKFVQYTLSPTAGGEAGFIRRYVEGAAGVNYTRPPITIKFPVAATPLQRAVLVAFAIQLDREAVASEAAAAAGSGGGDGGGGGGGDEGGASAGFSIGAEES
jgi:hypothetical protein